MAGFPFTYAVTPSEVQVRLGGWVVRRVALSDIERAEARPFGPDLIMNHHYTNVAAKARGAFVILRRTSGLVRNFSINPSIADASLADVPRESPHLAVARARARES